ncbi:MAG TPA: VWA-like domain-containing protein [Rubrivivax sp.]|nr:VWA-like domain-containing protein [Rubrivivax sp.]
MPEADTLFTHRGTRAVQRMVEHAPSSGGLALWVHHRDLPATAAAASCDEPPVTTDGRTLFYGAGFERLPLPQQAGRVAHAVLHIALRHAQRYQAMQQRTGDADLQLFNVCADAIVNSALAHLGWLKLPANAVQLDTLLATALGLRLDAEAALLAWDVERLYRAVDDRRASPTPFPQGQPVSDPRRRAGEGEAQRQQPGRGAAEADQGQDKQAPGRARSDGPRAASARALTRAEVADLRPGPGTRGAPEDEAEAAREWSERLQRAHAGDGAHSMLRTLLADLPRPRTPWEQALRAQLAHGLAQRPGLSWSRPSRSYLANQGRSGAGRRMPWEPGTTASSPVPRLVVVVDVSGSIDNDLMNRFASEIEAISRRLEAGLVLVVGDERVQRVEAFEPGRSDLRDIAFRGGGGTDFTPLLEEAQRHRPDITVVLTDLQGPARFRPRCPVIWAVPEAHRDAVPPFGRLLALH